MSDDEESPEGTNGQLEEEKYFRKTLNRKEKEEALEALIDQFFHLQALKKKKKELEAELDKKNVDIRASIVDQDIALEDDEFFCHQCQVKFGNEYKYTHSLLHN